MSLAGLRKISDDGVTFRSHLDGAIYELAPERAIEIQRKLRRGKPDPKGPWAKIGSGEK